MTDSVNTSCVGQVRIPDPSGPEPVPNASLDRAQAFDSVVDTALMVGFSASVARFPSAIAAASVGK